MVQALNGLETLTVLGQANGQPAAYGFLTTTGAIAALAGSETPVVTGITAHSGGGQTLATALTLGAFNNVTTVAGATDSVKLPASFVGATVTVANNGANAAQIFGTSPDTINSVATGTGISIPVGAIFTFTCAVIGNWLQNVQTGGAFTGTFDGVLGGNTPAAASVTTLAATGAISGGSTSDIAINTNKFTVAASTGNTLVAGTLNVTGNITPAAGITQAPQAGGASITLTSAKAGKTILLDTAAGTTVTLPAATGTGNVYRFFCTLTTTSAANKILAVGSYYLIGNINGTASTALTAFHALVGATYQSLQMPFAGSQPSGGIAGDWFEFTDVASAKWAVKGQFTSGTSPTTPFNTATS